MRFSANDIEVLLELQKIDLAIMQANKKRAELPQRALVAKLSKKKAELSAKAEQIAALHEKSAADMKKVETEDSQLADKQRRAQELIDTAGTDYRSVESHSKELSGFAKRRDALSERIEKLSGEIDKIKTIENQVNAAIATVDREESAARASFSEQDGKIAEEVAALKENRAGVCASLPAELVKLYESTAAKTGGVAVGHLVEDKCGVCRSAIDSGHLIQLKAQTPLGTCPVCKRLLVIE